MNTQAANEPAKPSAPAGDYMTDAKGRLVPATLVKPIDRQRDEMVRELLAKAKAMSNALAAFKRASLGDVRAFRELVAEKYQAKAGGAKGNVTLTSYDGRYKVTLQVQEKLVFTESLQVAKSLVDECVSEWSKGADAKVQALVAHAFQTDKQGQVSTERVLALRTLEIDDAKWLRAMGAIADSIHVQSSTTYLRFYERVGDDGDKYEAIPLDLAAL